MVAALENVVDLKRMSVIAAEREAHGIGGRIGGKAGAIAASVAQIAKREASLLRLERLAGVGEADAGEGIAERQQETFRAGVRRARMGRAEAGTGHLRRVS